LKEELNIFTYELNQIKDHKIKEFTIKALENAPSYFWHVAASSTGKYHPTYALGEGGLVRHTKAAVRFALEMFNYHSMQDYDDTKKDIIISALLLHDSYKHGRTESKFTITEHPLVASQSIRENPELSSMIDKYIFEMILQGIETHMTEWNKDFKTGKEVLPLPKHGYQKFIGLCDYLASRKCIEVKFEN
jgi:hypothetical protein